MLIYVIKGTFKFLKNVFHNLQNYVTNLFISQFTKVCDKICLLTRIINDGNIDPVFL